MPTGEVGRPRGSGRARNTLLDRVNARHQHGATCVVRLLLPL